MNLSEIMRVVCSIEVFETMSLKSERYCERKRRGVLSRCCSQRFRKFYKPIDLVPLCASRLRRERDYYEPGEREI